MTVFSGETLGGALGKCGVSGVCLTLSAPFRGGWSCISMLKGHLRQRLSQSEPGLAPRDAERW